MNGLTMVSSPGRIGVRFSFIFFVFFGVLHAPLTALKAMSPKGMTAGGPASGARTKRSEVAAAAGVTFETGRGPLSQRWAEGKVAASFHAATAEPEMKITPQAQDLELELEMGM